ncbi:LexA family transcriptional regulator [Candidatus Parcubacteria bacterium]|nr:LexA family transcriptional regulator [Candidatus Parcubacteria bacterium]
MKRGKDKIVSFYISNKRMPSYSELAALYGFKSKNAAYSLANEFIEENILEKDLKGFLIPGKQLYGIQVLGAVQAGFPTFAKEEKSDHLSLDEWLVNSADSTYLLEVSGDSMIDAGILEGDYVIVERTQDVSVGDIVIAEINDEWTMKYLRNKNGKPYLEAANDQYPDIYPEGDLEIHAVVRSLVRKYESKKK